MTAAKTEAQREAARERQRRYAARRGGQPDRGPCQADGCVKGARARGMCTTHLERERRWGHHLIVAKSHGAGTTDVERLWSQVQADGDCWLFTGATLANGYAQIGKSGQVHRVAYRSMVGDLPDELDLDHLCHNADLDCPGGPTCRHRRCVNPDHLDPVPRSVNAHRRWERERTTR